VDPAAINVPAFNAGTDEQAPVDEPVPTETVPTETVPIETVPTEPILAG
jgi:hypothetical protein